MLSREGHPLLLISHHIEPINGLADNVVCRQVDVAEISGIATAVAAAEAVHGPVGFLFNYTGTADARAFDDVEAERYTREIDTNPKGALNCTKAVLPGMKQRKSGTIINISSVGDRKTAPVALAYTASKYGLRAFGESLREAEGKNGIRVINIAPGYVRTNIHSQMHITFEEYSAILGNPDFMSAEELAEIVMFCWKQPERICIRDIVVTPTRTVF